MSYRRTTYIVCAAILSCGVALAQVQPGQSYPQAQTQQQAKPGQITRGQAVVADLTMRMLDETQAARTAIKNNNGQLALSDVRQALSFADRATMIAQSENLGENVPILAEFGTSTVIGPVQMAKAGLQPSRPQQPLTDEQAAQAGQAPAVQSVQAEAADITVNLATARVHLKAAEDALLKNDMAAADSALSAVEHDITITTAQENLPLVKARFNLALAHAMIREGHYQEALAPLNEASQALGSYSGKQAMEVSSLKSQLDSFIKNYPQERPQASSKVKQFWQEAAKLTSVSG